MEKLTLAWVDAQIEHELARGCTAPAVRDLAALVAVRDYLCDKHSAEKPHHERREMRDHNEIAIGEYNDRRAMGMQPTETPGPMTREKAEKWIRSMKTQEGKPLQHIPYTEIQRIAPNYGVSGEQETLDMWVVTNMIKSDHQDVGKKYANDSVDFYAALAKNWLNDPDAVEEKLAMYKRYIVRPEE